MDETNFTEQHLPYLISFNQSLRNSSEDLWLWGFPDYDTAVLERMLGPRRLPPSTLVPLTLVYGLVLVTGLAGNVLTCVVIVRTRYLHTATNCYLLNLAASDLLLLVLGLPQEAYSFWRAWPFPLGEAWCRLRLLGAEASSYASVLTIAAFTVERYLALCRPLRAPTSPPRRRAARVALGLWVAALLAALPVALQFGIVYIHRPDTGAPLPESAQCNTVTGERAKVVFQLSTFLFFLLPVLALVVLYSLIALAVRRSARPSPDPPHRSGGSSRPRQDPQLPHNGEADPEPLQVGDTTPQPTQVGDTPPSSLDLHAQQQARNRLVVLRMLVAVVVAFVLCWAPFHAQRLLVVYVTQWTPGLLRAHEVLFYVSGTLYYVSATINPLLYSLLSAKFRQACRALLVCPRPRHRRRHRSASSLPPRAGYCYSAPSCGHRD